MELKFFVVRVNDSTADGEGTPEIVVSRRHPVLLRRLMELEVPEVKSGLVEIKSIARQAGARSKVAVFSNKHDIDPIGACVGLRGIRIQNIVTELMGEKIDILEWSDNLPVFIANSLGPAQVEDVIIVDDFTAEVIVPENQLSLAIGKEVKTFRWRRVSRISVLISKVRPLTPEEAHRTTTTARSGRCPANG